MPTQTIAYIAFGSNLGNRRQNFSDALTQLAQLPQTKILKRGNLYRSKPIGGPSQPWFLNSAVKIRTGLSPTHLLSHLQKIENQMGRKRTVRWGPRIIDLDILSFGRRVIKKSQLQIPHPRLLERTFALRPLLDICPGWIHPAKNRRAGFFYRQLTLMGQRDTIFGSWPKQPSKPFRKKRNKKSP